MLLSLATLAAAADLEVLGARWEPCATSSLTSSVAEAVEAGESKLLYLEVEAATERLEAAADALICLSEPPDPALGARLWFLLGMANVEAGAEDAAQDAFRRALVFDQDLTWDDRFAPSKRAAFDAARETLQGEEQATLQLRGLAPDHLVYLDGRQTWEAEFAATSGEHVLHVRGPTTFTGALDLPNGVPSALLFPSTAAEPPHGVPAQRRWVRASTIGMGTAAVASAAVLGGMSFLVHDFSDRAWAAEEAGDFAARDAANENARAWMERKDTVEVTTAASGALFAMALTLEFTLPR